MNRPLILVTNDDGIDAKGINALIEVAKDFGDVFVVAPDRPQSGMSHAITVNIPIRIAEIHNNPNTLESYMCSGTPVDCVKIALNRLLGRKPDLLLSGINHGCNSAISNIYSGTCAAAREGAILNIPSISFSISDMHKDADFSTAKKFIPVIIKNIIENKIAAHTYLNVNVPKVNAEEIKGIRICRQTMGCWAEEFDERKDPFNRTYYWMTGYFNNCDKGEDNDEWALKNKYISIVPTLIDNTDYNSLESLKKLNYEL